MRLDTMHVTKRVCQFLFPQLFLAQFRLGILYLLV